MKNRIIIYLTIMFVFISCDNCEFQNKRNMKKYSGLVLDKNFYKWDRGVKSIIIESGNDELKYFFPTSPLYDNFWDKIQVGDSINKPHNDLNFSIYRNGRFLDSMELKFDCN